MSEIEVYSFVSCQKNENIKFCNANRDEDVVEYLKVVKETSLDTDVRLFAEVNNSVSQTVLAHKQVLAAASPFLAELLVETGDLEACLFLCDFSYSQLKLLVEYIYTGEIRASKHLMEEFEVCLKELGILGTHSYVESEKVAGLNTSESFSSVRKASRREVVGVQAKGIKPGHSKNCPERFCDEGSKSAVEIPNSDNESLPETSNAIHAPSVATPVQAGNQENIDIACSDCGEKFVTRAEWEAHAKNHCSSSTKQFICDVCHKTFRHLNVLKTHCRTHTGEKPFSCHICSRSFAHKSTLNEHLNLHSDQPGPYQCTTCSRRFKQRKGLRAHRCDDAQEEVHQCEICGRTNFINRKALALHRIHHESESKGKELKERNVLCDTCGRGFTNKYLLKAHQMTHMSSEEKNFVCSLCNKRFSHKKTLQVHEASHNGDKGPYRCSFCSKSFRYVANLDAHERIHTGQKPFICEVCGTAFRLASSLKEHMVTHQTSEERTEFACDICDRSFASRRQLVAHRYSHKNQTMRCPVCKKRFYNSEKLAAHVSVHENIEIVPDTEMNTVTAHVNEDGELIITQDVGELGDETLILAPSLLKAIQSTNEADEGNGNDPEHQDDGKPWSFEVVIDPSA